ncbi:MAG: hypothetical protein HDQ98_17660, partial [Lachnospiraceae bacterium]|nr:hypothetical protein [Lachnospiraceae bacterium]
MQQLRDIFDEYLTENPEQIDVVWIPVISSDRLAASEFSSITQYYMFRSYADDIPYTFINPRIAYGNFFLFKDASNFNFYAGSGAFKDSFISQVNYLTSIFGHSDSTGSVNLRDLYLINSDGTYLTTVQTVYDGAYTDSGLTTTGRSFYSNGIISVMYPFDVIGAFSNFEVFLVRGSKTDAASYVPIFSNLNAYKDWITGNGNYYRFDSGYTGGDITINPDADYSEITDAIRNAMQAALQSGKNVTAALSDMQKAFTAALDKLNESLGDISDNTAETNTWLEKIYQLLQGQQSELLEYFESSGKSLDDLIGLLSHTDSSGKVTSIYTLLGDFLLLFRVQQEDLQQFMEDAQDFFKMQPVKLGIMIEAAKQDIVDA